MYSLKQIIHSLELLGVSGEKAQQACEILMSLLNDLDEVTVKGRKDVDTMLGCMMALEQITGKDGDVVG